MTSFSEWREGSVCWLMLSSYKDRVLDRLKAFFRGETISGIKQLSQGRTTPHSFPLDDQERMVVRHLSHGGLLQVFTGDLFWGKSRPETEFHVALKAVDQGVATPPVLAGATCTDCDCHRGLVSKVRFRYHNLLRKFHGLPRKPGLSQKGANHARI